MVARILGKLLHMVGILPTDKVTEVQRTDLVGEFVGHTGPKTRRKVLHPSLSSESELDFFYVLYPNSLLPCSHLNRYRTLRVVFFLWMKLTG